MSTLEPDVGMFSPCPGCSEVGFSIEVYVDGRQKMQCDTDGCRVDEYFPIPEEEADDVR